MPLKKCNKCFSEKSLKSYEPDIRNKDGLQGICSDCRRLFKHRRRIERAAGKHLKPVDSKKCNKCGKIKDSSMFYGDSGISDGRATICKDCKNQDTLIWRGVNNDHYRAKIRANNHKNYQTNRLRRYRIDAERYAAILADQNNQCAICGKIPAGTRPLCVDHNHITGKVRGLLCFGCNRALHVLEFPEFLESCTAYLKKHE